MPFPDELKTPLAVVDYRPEWVADFAALSRVLTGVLGDVSVCIDHIGSTSVPGLAAKDCIDVQVRVRRLEVDVLRSAFDPIGFRLRPEPWNRSETYDGRHWPKAVFAPPPGARPVNVHVRPAGSPGVRGNLLFRDYLTTTPDVRDAWGEFKRRSAAATGDLAGYGAIKQPATVVLMHAAEAWALASGWRADQAGTARA